jgi:hypothetical protein
MLFDIMKIWCEAGGIDDECVHCTSLRAFLIRVRAPGRLGHGDRRRGSDRHQECCVETCLSSALAFSASSETVCRARRSTGVGEIMIYWNDCPPSADCARDRSLRGREPKKRLCDGPSETCSR